MVDDVLYMNSNNLIVTVLSVRGLSLKGLTYTDAYVCIVLNSPGALKSKAQTEVRRGGTECSWNENLEFSYTSLESILTVSVNNKTKLGSQCLGTVEFELREITNANHPIWYRLQKKKFISNSEKYYGEIQLKFQLSRSSNPSPLIAERKLSVLGRIDTLKKKMSLHRKGVSEMIGNISFRKDSIKDLVHRRSTRSHKDTSEESDEGSVDDTVSGHRSSSGSQHLDVPLRKTTGKQNACLRKSDPEYYSQYSLNSVNLDGGYIDNQNPIRRSGSTASSGFSSVRSTFFGGKPDKQSLEKLSRQELLDLIDTLRLEVAKKDVEIHSFQDYLDNLLLRVMETNPEILRIPNVSRLTM
ncbi:hypothetical protein AB6A40_002911 [Gnathostoma spinigerum]|uniref:FIP-RBD domain-containing protein n=1 Tax=Gnathostoma spinigerum TaxID=75299 RepID=A0ABD6EHP9_9BILA